MAGNLKHTFSLRDRNVEIIIKFGMFWSQPKRIYFLANDFVKWGFQVRFV
jgi:hypothetical protein